MQEVREDNKVGGEGMKETYAKMYFYREEEEGKCGWTECPVCYAKK